MSSKKDREYGRGTPNPKRALELMRLVYSKYPLPGVHF